MEVAEDRLLLGVGGLYVCGCQYLDASHVVFLEQCDQFFDQLCFAYSSSPADSCALVLYDRLCHVGLEGVLSVAGAYAFWL